MDVNIKWCDKRHVLWGFDLLCLHCCCCLVVDIPWLER